MKNFIQSIFIVLPVFVILTGCSADIPPYDESLTWEKMSVDLHHINADNGFYSIHDNKIWYSTDQGSSWIEIDPPSGLSGYHLYRFGENGVIYIIDESTLFRTTDNGSTWTQHGFPFNGYFLLHPSGHLFDGQYDAMYRTTDYGSSWHLVNVPRDHNNHIYNVTMANNGDLICFASPNSFYSTDEGLNWDTIPSPGVIRTFVNSASDIMINGSVTLRSTDHGLNWIDMNYRNDISDVLWVNGNLRLISGSAGVYRWLGDGTWSQLNSGLPDNPDCDEPWCYITALKMDTSGIVYANTYDGTYRSKQSIKETE